MVNIPENNAAELEAISKAKHDAELDAIAKQFLFGIKKRGYSEITCNEHMIGYNGSKEYHHICDTIEVAKMFAKKGYYCYYCDYYNSYRTNQRAVLVQKVPLNESDRSRGNMYWHKI